LILANDITERLQAERALHAAQERLQKYAEDLELRVAERTARLETSVKSLEGVLYHVAHDLRAPLRAMNGFTHLLVKNCCHDEDSQVRDFARRIKEASELMDEKIHDLLEFGKLGHQPVTMEPVDLAALVGTVLGRLEKEIQAKKAEVKVDAPMPKVMGDPDILEQVIENLVQNALTFVAPGKAPQIRIWTEHSTEHVSLYVEDHGIGIERQYQDKVFGLFQKVHEPGLYPGTGMGLAIARKAVERMGGRIGLSSDPGQGSRFWTELKAA
jgi:signal transduction histidine kinase